MPNKPDHPLAAVFDIALSWLLVGISHLTLVDIFQLFAAVAALIYSICRTVLLFRDRKRK